ncbi:hypothetical protein [Undibacterium pigrum]|uniref:Uncharacterized protein n=1 Tax=Undibacterium pigrum TaxID=401470 RepID=A0A318JJV2_9BURK|nr:hypothetical protein [Undibacterium pigrum]PXX44034.1 hypothetical protein DFR42_103303 [Undibacterium pigrum]
MRNNDTVPASMSTTRMQGTLSPYPRPSTRRGDFKKQVQGNDAVHGQHWNVVFSSEITTGTAIGMVVGGVLGMVNATLAVTISPYVIPGLDLLVATPLQAVFIGASLGTGMGAIVGSLLGWGISSQKPAEKLDVDLESNASFCPLSESTDDAAHSLETWKSQHGDYTNIQV